MTIELPKYPIKSLPSGGIPYPEDWEITIQPYKFGQSSNVATANITQARFYNLILSGVECNFDKSLFTVIDTLFLGLARKLISSKSDKVIISSICPECLTDIKTTARLVDAIRFESSKIKDRSKYPVEVHFSEYKAWFKFLTIEEHLKILKDEHATQATKLAMHTYKLVQLLDEPDNEGNTEKIIHSPEDPANTQTLISIYNSFTDIDAETLDKVLELFDGTDLVPFTVTCTNPECQCKFEREMNTEGLSNFISPFRDEEGGLADNNIIL